MTCAVTHPNSNEHTCLCDEPLGHALPHCCAAGHCWGPGSWARDRACWDHEAIHAWFELTYSNYLVLHRTLLQSMPDAWQARFVDMLRDLADAFEGVEVPGSFLVRARAPGGFLVRDTVPHYDRGRAHVEPRSCGHNVCPPRACPACRAAGYGEDEAVMAAVRGNRA